MRIFDLVEKDLGLEMAKEKASSMIYVTFQEAVMGKAQVDRKALEEVRCLPLGFPYTILGLGWNNSPSYLCSHMYGSNFSHDCLSGGLVAVGARLSMQISCVTPPVQIKTSSALSLSCLPSFVSCPFHKRTSSHCHGPATAAWSPFRRLAKKPLLSIQASWASSSLQI